MKSVVCKLYIYQFITDNGVNWVAELYRYSGNSMHIIHRVEKKYSGGTTSNEDAFNFIIWGINSMLSHLTDDDLSKLLIVHNSVAFKKYMERTTYNHHIALYDDLMELIDNIYCNVEFLYDSNIDKFVGHNEYEEVKEQYIKVSMLF